MAGIGNQEHEGVNSTWVVESQRVRVVNNSMTVLTEDELARITVELPHNETVHEPYTVSPTMTEERLRLVFLL